MQSSFTPLERPWSVAAAEARDKWENTCGHPCQLATDILARWSSSKLSHAPVLCIPRLVSPDKYLSLFAKLTLLLTGNQNYYILGNYLWTFQQANEDRKKYRCHLIEGVWIFPPPNNTGKQWTTPQCILRWVFSYENVKSKSLTHRVVLRFNHDNVSNDIAQCLAFVIC